MDANTRADLQLRLKADTAYAQLSTHQERIVYILQHFLSYEALLCSIQGQLERARSDAAKSSLKSANYAEEATVHGTAGNWTDALGAIRKALLYAETAKQSKANFSLVNLYVQMATIQAELDNIQGALWAVEQAISFLEQGQEGETGTSTKEELATLRAKYQIILEKHRGNDADETALGQWRIEQANEVYAEVGAGRQNRPWHMFPQPGAVTIRSSPQTGRHFVATSSIAAETILLLERPYSLILQKEVLQLKCANCFLALSYRYVPCSGCTEAVYCSRDCARQHGIEWHWAVCGGLLEVVRAIGSFPLHVFQMVTKVGGPRKALQLQAAKAGYSIEQYLEDYATKDDLSVPNYTMSSILADHDALHSAADNVNHLLYGMEIATTLLLAHGGADHYQADLFLPFAAMLATDLRRVVYNVFGWTDWSTEMYIANCQCLVGSLVNHSCNPNTRWEWKDGIITFTAKRDIAPGEEVTISYGPGTGQSYASRQTRLNHYRFACVCADCFKDATTGETSLRCPSCPAGAVLYESAVNKEATLNGRCLSCYAPYPSFSRSIRELTRSKTIAKMAASLSLILGPQTGDPAARELLSRTVEILGHIQGLTLPGSEPSLKVTLRAVQALEQLGKLIQELPLGERIDLAVLVDRCLPEELPESMIDGKVVKSMHWWFGAVTNWAKELNYYDAMPVPGEPPVNYEPRDGIHLVGAFHRRLQAALKVTQDPAKDDAFLARLTAEQLSLADEKRDAYESTFTELSYN